MYFIFTGDCSIVADSCASNHSNPEQNFPTQSCLPFLPKPWLTPPLSKCQITSYLVMKRLVRSYITLPETGYVVLCVPTALVHNFCRAHSSSVLLGSVMRLFSHWGSLPRWHILRSTSSSMAWYSCPVPPIRSSVPGPVIAAYDGMNENWR